MKEVHGQRSQKRNMSLTKAAKKIRLSSGKYKTRKVDLMDWNRQENADLWRKAWADMANDFLERNGSAERTGTNRNFWRG